MDELVQRIRVNMHDVEDRMCRAARRAGRMPESVRLVVVTKAQPPEVHEAAILSGAKILGENYPEETAEKLPLIPSASKAAWHMIGHLQSRKAKLVSAHFNMLESLDSLDLARKLERLLAEANRTLPVLLECNVSGEESKSGWNAWEVDQWGNLAEEFAKLAELPHLQVKGLMTMPPLAEDAEIVRPYFERLRLLSEYLRRQLPVFDWQELSMGTSADFETAISEGATLIRIGTAIVGSRPPRHP